MYDSLILAMIWSHSSHKEKPRYDEVYIYVSFKTLHFQCKVVLTDAWAYKYRYCHFSLGFRLMRWYLHHRTLSLPHYME